MLVSVLSFIANRCNFQIISFLLVFPVFLSGLTIPCYSDCAADTALVADVGDSKTCGTGGSDVKAWESGGYRMPMLEGLEKLEASAWEAEGCRVDEFEESKSTEARTCGEESVSKITAGEHFRTYRSGGWTGVWECSSDSVNWAITSATPSVSSKSITIMPGHTVQLTSIVAFDNMLIAEGAVVVCLSGTTLVIADGAGDDVVVRGELRINNPLDIQPNATVVVKGSGLVHYESRLSKIIYPFIWEAGSTLYIDAVAYHSIPSASVIEFIDGHCENLIISPVRSEESVYELYVALDEDLYVNGNLTIASATYKPGDVIYFKNRANVNVACDMLVKNVRVATNQSASHANSFNVSGNFSMEGTSYFDIKSQCSLNLWGDLNMGETCNFSNPGLGITFNSTNRIQTVNSSKSLYCKLRFNEGSRVTIPNLALSSPLYFENNSSLISNSRNTNSTFELETPDADWSSGMSGWQMISSPIENQAVNLGGFTYPAGDANYDKYDFYEWNESAQLWMNQKLPENSITEFVEGMGYLTAYDDGGIKVFKGVLTNTDVIFENLSLTGDGLSGGFHLMGNPFSSSLDWYSSAWNRQNVSDVAQVWDPVAENYMPITRQNRYILPLRGFFIQVLDPVNAITIPKAGRAHYDEKKSGESEKILVLKVSGKDESTWDQAVIRLDADANVGRDVFDGFKLEGSDNAPRLYTNVELSDGKISGANRLTGDGNGLVGSKAGSFAACVNALPFKGLPSVVPLFFRPVGDNAYNLQVLENSIDKGVYLEDKFTGLTTLLTTGSSYEFAGKSSDSESRFVLHFGPLGLNEELASDLSVYAANGFLYFVWLNQDSFGSSSNVSVAGNLIGSDGVRSYSVYDLTGNVLLSGSITAGSNSSVNLNHLPKGVYVVRVSGGSSTDVRKFVL